MVFDDQLDRHKKMVLLVLLVFTIGGSWIFMVLNYWRGQWLLAMVEGITGALSLLIFVLVWRTQSNQKLHRLALLYVLIFFAVMMFAFASPGVSATIFVWSLAIPSVAYLLLGVGTGFWVTVIFLTISWVLYFDRSLVDPVLQETVAYANVIMCAMLLWALSHTYELTNQRAKNKLHLLAIHDHMTGLYNRSALSHIYTRKLTDSVADQQTLCLLLFDLDHFKKINDELGHAVGDAVLQAFARLLAAQGESNHSAFRVGGEEFILLLPSSSHKDAYQMAEQIRSQTEQMVVGQAPSVRVTVSIGMAVAKTVEHSLEVVLKQADERMYLAKSQGRNRVVDQG